MKAQSNADSILHLTFEENQKVPILMKKSAFLLAFATTSFFGFAQNNDYFDKVKAFQESLNSVQSNQETTQIIAEEFPDFTGLEFFDIDERYRVKARLELSNDPHEFKLTYSDAPDVPIYINYGVLYFTLDDVDYSLNVYQNKAWLQDKINKTHLFLPFKDWTNGPVSYGGGRFINLNIPESGDIIIVDFNLSYNPPCAYNYYMACPLIPEANQIEREIHAGILAY